LGASKEAVVLAAGVLKLAVWFFLGASKLAVVLAAGVLKLAV